MTTSQTSSAAVSKKVTVLDILIVGGGPGGTAAAFRARELGLKALIIDYDDLMKRIRDYSKDKMILPGFGGGDTMKFPKGGSLIQSLHFDPIDKDDMCNHWKNLHREHRIPSRIGVELTGLKRRPDGLYRVSGWDHPNRCERHYLTKTVILAIGCGVPRRLEIPGNTDGIAFRLSDPAVFVGRPACVIGGGTSAAEAVIAISNAKIQAEDPSAVYWSYRGDRLPRVSKALAEVFFEAYVGNGNIRYQPKSEPAAIVTAEDHQEYLAIRFDRRCIEGRPTETSHLEFQKSSCLACIGEDLPKTLLESVGIRMVHGGPRNKKRMVVNRYMESEQPHVYLVGDILSQAYFRTDDFEGDPTKFEEVKHRGNIKSALRDGVLVAQIIKQRLEGKKDIDISLEEVEAAVTPPVNISRKTPMPPSANASLKDSLPPTPVSLQNQARLLVVMPNGMVESEHPLLPQSETTIGRKGAHILFPHDTLMEELHASISHGEEGFSLRDRGSASGVFLRVPPAARRELQTGDLIRAGRQFLLFGGKSGDFWFKHYNHEGKELGQTSLSDKMMILGRAAPDLTLNSEDMSLSRRHLALAVYEGKITIKDLNSANGTYLRVKNTIPLTHGDQFQMGHQLLAFNEHGDSVMDLNTVGSAAPKKVPVISRLQSEAPAVAEGGPSVTFRNLGKTFPATVGQTICEVAESNGVSINAECHAGVCGSDPIRIIAGAENLKAPPGNQETETLEDLCDLEAGPCRLACMARIKGPVTVELVQS